MALAALSCVEEAEMSYTREFNNPAEREAAAKRIYEATLRGDSDDVISGREHVEIWQVQALRKYWIENKLPKEVERSEAQTKWRERTERWHLRLEEAYENQSITPKDAISAYKQLASIGIDLDALAEEKSVTINHRGSKVDAAIEELLGEFPAEKETDLPL